MPDFSQRSRDRLATCHPDLRRLFEAVIAHHDCTVLEGHRSDDDQEKAFKAGKSTLRAGQSKHNRKPSTAADVAPFPIDWADHERFRVFGGFVLGMAAAMGIPLRWGGDWDGDWTFDDQQFVDLPHFELRS